MLMITIIANKEHHYFLPFMTGKLLLILGYPVIPSYKAFSDSHSLLLRTKVLNSPPLSKNVLLYFSSPLTFELPDTRNYLIWGQYPVQYLVY